MPQQNTGNSYNKKLKRDEKIVNLCKKREENNKNVHMKAYSVTLQLIYNKHIEEVIV